MTLVDVQLKMKNKAQLVADLSASQKEPNIVRVVEMLDVLIEELREDNDTAEETLLYRNQGEIRGFKKLKNYIQVGVPSGMSE